MATQHHKPEDIVTKRWRAEALLGKCITIADAVHQIVMTRKTYCQWGKLYGGMWRDQLRRLKELERENQRQR